MNSFKKLATVLIFGVILSLAIITTTSSAAKYKVNKDDSLYKVSKLFKTTINTLKKDNNLTSNTIFPGQLLDVRARIYTVKPGDTYYKIAKKHNLKIEDIKKASNKKSNKLIVGKKLVLPGIKPVTKAKATNSNALISYTQAEYDLLARLISAEAQGEPYNAMVAVGAVVVNRVHSKEWPSTINSVINHVPAGYYQFTPVKNGYINNPATEEAKEAAKAAINGSDPSKGAMFYFDESCTNEWLWSKPLAARIGQMVYVY